MSQSKVSGVVQSISTKVKNTRAGDKTIHYTTVDNQTFSTGFSQPFSVGEMVNIVVEFKYGENQYVPNVVPSGLPLLGSQPAPVKKAWGGAAPARKFPVDKHDGQMSIIRQNSMNRAVEILAQWMQPDHTGIAIYMPTTQDEYLKKLMEVAMTITDFNSGQDIMKMQAAQQANQQVMQ